MNPIRVNYPFHQKSKKDKYMRKPAILITGANGEMGHGLITALHARNNVSIVALDLNPLDKALSGLVYEELIGNILDQSLIEQLNGEYEFDAIYHLAALLSTRAEFSPRAAHDVNVGGTLSLLNLAVEQGRSRGVPVKFFFPSSIAVYGFSGLDAKNKAGAIPEDSHRNPSTMYGCNKLYCEHLGHYYMHYFQRLGADNNRCFIDFRSIRFPGIISSKTIPSAGTSDYIPEMLHAAAKGEPYQCFVREDTQIPFMTMPDAIFAITSIMSAPAEDLSRTVYNIRSFAPSAEVFRQRVLEYFPQADIGYHITEKRQKMVDSWPLDTDDSKAREDWRWKPVHGLDNGLKDYLVPELKEMYKD
ncbi:MAG: NAD-dependent epimerase/dehydratase family protein [Candidatus Marinimicrobia bacterium]|nr:NAD-dependent epimerase/dehydratase family protein [Candidatus Neomarinimicrobiota bacterium]